MLYALAETWDKLPCILNEKSPVIDLVNTIVYYTSVKTSEFLRWLKQQGATFDAKKGKGSHIRVALNGKQTVVPSHSKDLKRGTVEAIKKQLGIKGER